MDQIYGLLPCSNCGEVFHKIRFDRYRASRQPNATWFELLPEFGPGGANWDAFPINDPALRGADLACPGCGHVYLQIHHLVRWYVREKKKKPDRYLGQGQKALFAYLDTRSEEDPEPEGAEK